MILLCLMAMAGFVLGAAWTGHTDESRAYAQDFCDALADCGITKKAAYLLMRLTNEQQLSHQLAGTEPLNAFRLAYLPSAFRVAFLRRQADRLGAAVIAPEELSLIRGAAALGPERVEQLIPSRPYRLRTVTLPLGQNESVQ